MEKINEIDLTIDIVLSSLSLVIEIATLFKIIYGTCYKSLIVIMVLMCISSSASIGVCWTTFGILNQDEITPCD